MTSTTAAGSTLAISAATPATRDATGYGALTFTEIGQVEKLGSFGASFAKVEFQPLKGAKQKYKGSADFGALQPSIALDSADAGQSLLQTASDDETQKLYSFRVIFQDGSKRYFLGRAFGMPETVDGADSMLTATPTIEICTRVVKVAADATATPTPTPAPTPTPSPTPTPTPTPTLTLSSAVSQNEGSSGTTAYVYTVTLSQAAGSGGVNVPWSFTAGTTDQSDYVGGVLPTGGTLAIAQGQTSGIITINVAGDSAVEANESFTVLISTPSGYVAGASMSATGTVLNDDAATPAPTPTPTPSATLTNAQLLAALPANPVMAVIGASLEAYGINGRNNSARTTDEAALVWGASMARDYFQIPMWGDAVNDRHAYGYNFALSGASLDNAGGMVRVQVPALYSSDAKLVYVNRSRNDFDGSQSIAAWNDPTIAMVKDIIAHGMAVVFQESYEAGTEAGGVWSAGNSARTKWAQIVADQNSRLADLGVPVVPFRDAMTYVNSNGDRVPYDGLTNDGKHNKALGGYTGGKVVAASLKQILKVPAAGINGTNLFGNTALTGTDGTVSGTATGSAPSGFTVNASGLHPTTSAIEQVGGVNTIKLTADLTSGGTDASDLDRVSFPVSGLVVGNWYRAQITVACEANAARRAITFGDNDASDALPWDSGNSSQTGANANLTPLPTEAFTLTREVLFKAGATTNTLRVDLRYVQGATPVVTRISQPKLFAAPDYTKTIGPVAQAVATAPVTEGETLDATLAVNADRDQTVTWSKVSGAASLTLVNGTTVRFTSPAYDASGTNSYSAVFRATDQSGRASDVTVTRTSVSAAAFRLRSTGAAVITASGNLVLTEPTGVAQGDLLVACIGYRDTPEFTLPAGWTLATKSTTAPNTTNGSTSSISGVLVAYITRGASAPDLTFVRSAGTNARGQIMAYKNPAGFTLDAVSVDTLSAGSTTATAPALVTTKANDLLVAVVSAARINNISNVFAATDPVTPSGAVTTTGDPVAGAWIERGDGPASSFMALGVYDAIKATAGDTGAFSATAGGSGRHAMAVVAFKAAS